MIYSLRSIYSKVESALEPVLAWHVVTASQCKTGKAFEWLLPVVHRIRYSRGLGRKLRALPAIGSQFEVKRSSTFFTSCKVFCIKMHFTRKILHWGLAIVLVKSRKQEHSKMRSCRLILWRQASEDKNQKQTDLFRCSSEMVHLINLNKKFRYISVNKLLTIGNRTPLSVFRDMQIVLSSCMIEIAFCNNKYYTLYISMQSSHPQIYLTHAV